MRYLFALLLAIGVIGLSGARLCAQQRPAVPMDSIVRPAAAASSTSYTPSSLVMIENRAKTLGSRLSASGTQYFAVRDADLIGKTPDEVLTRLSPPVITPGAGLRQVDIVVDLQRPITLFPAADRPANIGTAVVQSMGFTNIAVNSAISGAQITVLPKNKE